MGVNMLLCYSLLVGRLLVLACLGFGKWLPIESKLGRFLVCISVLN